MSEQLLTVLKFCLLALLYLFFLRVLRAVWTEINPPKVVTAPAGSSKKRRGSKRAGRATTSGSPRGRAAANAPSHLVVVEPIERSGLRFELGSEETIGRSAGCSIVFDERYVSQVHARFFRRGDTVFVEDLGSTNGTWINGSRAVGQMPVRLADRIQIGNLIMEAK